ncbi:hypothetical protein HHK36_012020 [Tetracentron sinense]|uniref:DC1 domain-containing protein n=1 Tax=Tetracentron sinense TaxID=13715 RepID=A0A834Z9G0_TETSI|nr:hypothetical protein HHK36_012020 [Tetracentron sinense]
MSSFIEFGDDVPPSAEPEVPSPVESALPHSADSGPAAVAAPPRTTPTHFEPLVLDPPTGVAGPVAATVSAESESAGVAGPVVATLPNRVEPSEVDNSPIVEPSEVSFPGIPIATVGDALEHASTTSSARATSLLPTASIDPVDSSNITAATPLSDPDATTAAPVLPSSGASMQPLAPHVVADGRRLDPPMHSFSGSLDGRRLVIDLGPLLPSPAAMSLNPSNTASCVDTSHPGRHLHNNIHPMQTRGKSRAAGLLHSLSSPSIPPEPPTIQSARLMLCNSIRTGTIKVHVELTPVAPIEPMVRARATAYVAPEDFSVIWRGEFKFEQVMVSMVWNGRSTQQETGIQHFSHVHPLQLSNLQQERQVQCNGCNEQCTELAYRCLPCNYTLHKSCAQIPRSIKHPSHPDHPLTLLATPPYANTSFSCDACGRQGSAFSFHCAICEFDIHANCASLPRKILHQAHPHELLLLYASPYGEVTYTCDICGAIGSDHHWMYRCATCGFDAHLGCATSKPQEQQFQHNPSQSQPRPQWWSSPVVQLNPLLQAHLLANEHTANQIAQGGISELFRNRIEANTRLGNELMRSTFEAQTRTINDEIARINAADQYERMLAPPTSNHFQVKPIGQITPPDTLPRPFADLLLHSMQQMSVNNTFGDGNLQQGVGVSAMGESSGLQGANQGFGNRNQA